MRIKLDLEKIYMETEPGDERCKTQAKAEGAGVKGA